MKDEAETSKRDPLYTTANYLSLVQLPSCSASDGESTGYERLQRMAAAVAEAEYFPGEGRGSVPSEKLFAAPSPKDLHDALVLQCGGDTRLADAIRSASLNEALVKRLREEVKKLTSEARGADLEAYPYLGSGETNTHVRQATHDHASAVLTPLPQGARALYLTLVLRASWGGYVKENAKGLIAAFGAGSSRADVDAASGNTVAQKSAYYKWLRVLEDRAIVVSHPYGLMLNPALAAVGHEKRHVELAQDFSYWFGRFRAKRGRGDANFWGHSTASGERPTGVQCVGVVEEDVVAEWEGGGISAYVVALPSHVRDRIAKSYESSAQTEGKRRKVRASGHSGAPTD